jgi:hypothetical protein
LQPVRASGADNAKMSEVRPAPVRWELTYEAPGPPVLAVFIAAGGVSTGAALRLCHDARQHVDAGAGTEQRNPPDTRGFVGTGSDLGNRNQCCGIALSGLSGAPCIAQRRKPSQGITAIDRVIH